MLNQVLNLQTKTPPGGGGGGGGSVLYDVKSGAYLPIFQELSNLNSIALEFFL